MLRKIGTTLIHGLVAIYQYVRNHDPRVECIIPLELYNSTCRLAVH